MDVVSADTAGLKAEAVRLAAAGVTRRVIAGHVGRSTRTVDRWLDAAAAVRRRPGSPGSGQRERGLELWTAGWSTAAIAAAVGVQQRAVQKWVAAERRRSDSESDAV
jgi:transposase